MATLMRDLGLDQLSDSQKIALALEIWERLGENRPSRPLSHEETVEMNRRNDDLEKNPEIARTWKQTRDSMEQES